MDLQKEEFQKRLNDMFIRVMSGRDFKEVARRMGISIWSLYKYQEGVNDFPVHRIALLYQATGDIRAAQVLLPDGVLAVAPKPKSQVADVFAAEAINSREAGEAHAVLMEALENGRIDPWEIEKIKQEYENAATSCILVIKACEMAAERTAREEQLCFA